MGRAGQGGTMPRIMVVALLVIVAGGAALFWPRGGSVPTGIGEHQSTVSSRDSMVTPTGGPRSGDVDISAAGGPGLTPEKPAADQVAIEKTTTPPAKSETQVPAAKKKVDPPKATQSAPKKTSPPRTSEPKVTPSSQGQYAVQVGAFGEAANADNEAARLKTLGWDARVRAGNNSSGEMVFRVWIGYFSSRQTAQTFINQNSKQLSGAIPVHR
jgi:DedD protein